MKITQDVRDYAAQLGVSDESALQQGLAAKSAEFKSSGGGLYIPIRPVTGQTSS